MGRYPNRYKQPANKMEEDSNSLAQKLTKARGSFTPAVQKYVDAMRSTSTATDHAQHAEALMQQVRALGRMPKGATIRQGITACHTSCAMHVPLGW